MKKIISFIILMLFPFLVNGQTKNYDNWNIGGKISFHSGTGLMVGYIPEKSNFRFILCGLIFKEQFKQFYNIGFETNYNITKLENADVYTQLGFGYYDYKNNKYILDTKLLENKWRIGIGLGLKNKIKPISFYYDISPSIVIDNKYKVFPSFNFSIFYSF